MANDTPDYSTVTVTPETPIPSSPFSLARDGLHHLINGVQLPIGCQWLCFAANPATTINALVVTGTTTGIDYASSLLAGADLLLYVRVHQAIDPVVNLDLLIAAGAGTATVGICFGFTPTVIDLDTLVPNPAFLVSPADQALLTAPGVGGGLHLAVTEQFAFPSQWQVPDTNKPIAAVSVAAGGTLPLIALVGGKTVRLFDYSFSQDASNAASHWALQDDTGAAVASYFDAAVRKVFAEGSFGGMPLGLGRGLQIVNNGANASFLGGFINFTQS
jgi:hypothetical protein